MKESFVSQCLDILKREDIKNEIKTMFRPIIDFILCELYPYIYLIVILVFLIFLMILAILFILIFNLRSKNSMMKISTA
jgi:hypothetical protein